TYTRTKFLTFLEQGKEQSFDGFTRWIQLVIIREFKRKIEGKNKGVLVFLRLLATVLLQM
ncbi:MAG: hypothetical protein WB587_11610, partial [Nitrososphaeraceae archaeon]